MKGVEVLLVVGQHLAEVLREIRLLHVATTDLSRPNLLIHFKIWLNYEERLAFTIVYILVRSAIPTGALPSYLGFKQ